MATDEPGGASSEPPLATAGGQATSPPSTSDVARRYVELLLARRRHEAIQVIMDASKSGMVISDLYLEVLQTAQREFGDRWERGEINVAEEHHASVATASVMSMLAPVVAASTPRPRPLRCLVSSVAGNHHELGARMVADFFEMSGWRTYYTSANTPADSIVEMLIELKAAVLAVSAGTEGDREALQDLIERVRSEPRTADVLVLVGGHLFNTQPDLWVAVGADGTGIDAPEAVATAERLLQNRQLTSP